jgi:hypothetical protein
MNRAVSVLTVLVVASCVGVKKGEIEELKPAIEAFHQRVRWKDFRGAADLMIVEKRPAFLKARAKLKDDRDLFVTNFELEDAKISGDLMSATAVTKLSWYRLPSTTEETVTVTSLFVWREGMWQLESQDDGPFEELKPAPVPEPHPAPRDAG